MTPPFNLESRVAVLESRIDTVETSQDAMAEDVRMIRDVVIGAKGGWKMILLIGSAGAAAGALFMKLLPLFVRFP